MAIAQRSSQLGRKRIALLHVARKQLGLSDDEWRAILAGAAGVESSTELDLEGFDEVLRRLGELGFRSPWSKRSFGQRRGMATPAQVELMRGLWATYHGSADPGDAALNRWLGKYARVSALRFVDDRKVQKVIAALKAMAQRPRS